ncbi:MAG TPA: hypothetical protein VEJ63_07760 [Planctomycetota bacterium]|nr:hypothetical protein [Planctomycetota bacterium]
MGEGLEAYQQALVTIAPDRADDRRQRAALLALSGFCLAYSAAVAGLLPVLRYVPLEAVLTFKPEPGQISMGYYGYLLNGCLGMSAAWLLGSFVKVPLAVAVWTAGVCVAAALIGLPVYEYLKLFK